MLLHFIKRDCQDNAIGWGLIVVLTVLHYVFFSQYAERSLIGFYGTLGGLYYLFSLFQQMTVWGGGAPVHNSALARQYLQSLPVSRIHLFWLCVARAIVPALPFALFLCLLPFLLKSHTNSHPLWDLWRKGTQYGLYVALMCLTVFFGQLTCCRLSLFNDVIRRTVGKGARLWKYTQYIAVDNVIGVAATFSPFLGVLISGIMDDSNYLFAFLALGTAFNLWQLRRSQKQWMWE
jgi:hypothetical protein